jgi:hypothetical protein
LGQKVPFAAFGKLEWGPAVAPADRTRRELVSLNGVRACGAARDNQSSLVSAAFGHRCRGLRAAPSLRTRIEAVELLDFRAN